MNEYGISEFEHNNITYYRSIIDDNCSNVIADINIFNTKY